MSLAARKAKSGRGLHKRNKKSVLPVMNVTPLIDVVLVLLIVFMVITPMLKKTFFVQLPKQEEKEVPQDQPDDGEPPVVLSINDKGEGELNGTVVPLDEFIEKLRRVYAARDDHTIFFDAHDDAPYGISVQYLDRAREAGAINIAILTKRPKGEESQP